MPKKGQRNREQIIAAADELFYQRGFHQTSMADIASACGIPKGNFYFYFKSKDDILFAVVDARLSRLKTRLTHWEREFSDPKTQLLRISEMIIRDWSEIARFGCPMGTLLLELGKQEEAPRDHAVSLFNLLKERLTALFSELLPPEDAAIHARTMLLRMQGASVMASVYRDETWLFDEQRAIADWVKSFGEISRQGA